MAVRHNLYVHAVVLARYVMIFDKTAVITFNGRYTVTNRVLTPLHGADF